MSIIRNIIDFIFPLMPSEPRTFEQVSIKVENITGERDVLSRKADVTRQYFEDERGRTHTIESKASMFITSSGFLGTVLIGTANILVGQKSDVVWLRILMVISLLFFAIYMVATILNALRALKRATYSRPDPTTVMEIAEQDNFDRQAIADLVNSTYYNQNSTNQKMDYVIVAQRHYKRLMLSVLAFIILLLIYVLHQNGVSLLKWLSGVNAIVSTWSFNTWYVLVSSLLLIVSVIMGIVALVKINNLKEPPKERE